jgi:hypothetical protein
MVWILMCGAIPGGNAFDPTYAWMVNINLPGARGKPTNPLRRGLLIWRGFDDLISRWQLRLTG